MDNEHHKKDKDSLKAMVYDDGTLVLHNEVPGFTIEIHDSELGSAKPIDIKSQEIEKAKKEGLRTIRLDMDTKKIWKDKKNDSKDV